MYLHQQGAAMKRRDRCDEGRGDVSIGSDRCSCRRRPVLSLSSHNASPIVLLPFDLLVPTSSIADYKIK